MKLVIFAGGYGTRLAELTSNIPKPLVPIGEKPILWHIMKYYSMFGVREFVILAGYKASKILSFFQNYRTDEFDVEINTCNGEIVFHNDSELDWQVRIIDTGLDTLTGSRLYRARHALGDAENFLLTYGDGLSDVDISELIRTHEASKNIVTLTAVSPPGRFGALTFGETGKVLSFDEKPKGDGSFINGGFFVVSQQVFSGHFTNDLTTWETDILSLLAKNNQLGYYMHTGFWQSMDTLREKQKLDLIWNSKSCPWKIW